MEGVKKEGRICLVLSGYEKDIFSSPALVYCHVKNFKEIPNVLE